MIAALRLLPVLIRRAPRQAAGAAALCAVGVAVATLVAGTALAAYSGLDARESRIAWREPTAATRDEPTTALQRRSLEFYEGQRIDRVDLAAAPDPAADASAGAVTDPAAEPDPAGSPWLPAPPGVRSFPEPGTAFVSPALAELIANTPGDRLGDRFGQVVGTIGRAGLASPDERVAVVGADPDDLGPVDLDAVRAAAEEFGSRLPSTPSVLTPIHSFASGSVDETLELYRDMALVAVVLVSVPAFMLVGSAARLTAARREQRLAAVRLAGATPGAVRALAAAETALGAAAGAVVGVGAAMLLAPLLHGVEVAGGSWFTSDLRLSLPAAFALMVGAVLVSVVAAVVSLRRVTSQPLGVARASEPQRARWPRAIGVVVSFAGMVVAMTSARGGGAAFVLVAALAFVILSLGLVGPWIASLVGRVMALVARRPATLLAGRRITEDPRAAYRVVSAVVLAGMVAGFLAGILPTTEARLDGGVDTDLLALTLPEEAANRLTSSASELAGQFPGTVAEVTDSWTGSDGRQLAGVTVSPGPGVDLEQLRTATASQRMGHTLVSADDDVWGDAMLVGDVRRGSLVVLLAGLVLAAGSSAVAAAASVVDQRRTIGRLALSGVPVAMLQSARRWQSTVPLVAATGGAVALGLGSSVLIMMGFGARPDQIVRPELLQLLAIVVGAAALGLVSAAATRPLLVAAARSGTSTTPS
jgi:hypothetical protein